MSHLDVGGVRSIVRRRSAVAAGAFTGGGGRREDPGGDGVVAWPRRGRRLPDDGVGDRRDGLEPAEDDEGGERGEERGGEDDARLDGDLTDDAHQLNDVGTEARQLASERRRQPCVVYVN